MAKLSPKASKYFKMHYLRHSKEYPKQQALAIAYSETRKKGYKVPKFKGQ